MIMNSDTRLLEHVHLAGAILSIVFHKAVNHCAFELSDAVVNMQISLDLFHVYYAQILNHAKTIILLLFMCDTFGSWQCRTPKKL